MAKDYLGLTSTSLRSFAISALAKQLQLGTNLRIESLAQKIPEPILQSSSEGQSPLGSLRIRLHT